MGSAYDAERMESTACNIKVVSPCSKKLEMSEILQVCLDSHTRLRRHN